MKHNTYSSLWIIVTQLYVDRRNLTIRIPFLSNSNILKIDRSKDVHAIGGEKDGEGNNLISSV